MPIYESVLVARQDITKIQCDKITQDSEAIITSLEGSVKKKEYWGLRNLAYEINKNKKGHYTMLIIECNPEAIFEYERQLKLNEDIIRYMSIRIKKWDEAPSIMLKNINDNQ